MAEWTIETAKRFYNISQWSEGCFDVNERGRVCVRCADQDEQMVDLVRVTKMLQDHGLELPILVRFPQLLHKKLGRLQSAFDQAIATHRYQNRYSPVYPIKVNQQATVVDQLLHSTTSKVGLEVGSKAELLAALGLCNDPARPIICNGYKDRSYIRIALIGKKIGLQIYIVIEKLSELELVFDEAHKLDVHADLGVRIRLESVASGKWQNTGGIKSKFGLRLTDILTLVDQIRHASSIASLRMLHFHMGSQISNLDEYEAGLREAACLFSELKKMDMPLAFLDIGGGLAVDYEGTGGVSCFSKAYSVEEYADLVVRTLARHFHGKNEDMPVIVTENGRAMVAHHAILLADVIDSERHFNAHEELSGKPGVVVPKIIASQLDQLEKEWSLELESEISQEIRALFYASDIDLITRVNIEQRISALREMNLNQPQVTARIEPDQYADKYFVNFSMFQSLPDVWGLSQVFPILPIQHLDIQPTRSVRLQDLTCDSDGHIEYYVNNGVVSRTLNLHPIIPGEDYVIAVFLVGAYQEILGDMHNLFGDTHAADVEVDPDGGLSISALETGDRVKDLLEYVHIQPEKLIQSYNRQVNHLSIDDAEKARLSTELLEALDSYCYLKNQQVVN